jgi:hypothetical protein
MGRNYHEAKKQGRNMPKINPTTLKKSLVEG